MVAAAKKKSRAIGGGASASRSPSPATSAEAESVSLWFRLLNCHAMMLGELRRELEDTMTLARFDLLASLNRDDGQMLAALSRALLVTAGNVTGLVDRAERDGLVARRPEPTDRRVARVWLTPAGRELIATLLPLHSKHVHALIGSLGAADRRELRRLLGRLREHLHHVRNRT